MSKQIRLPLIALVAAVGVTVLAGCDKAPPAPPPDQPAAAPQADVAPAAAPATSAPREEAPARRASAAAPTRYEDYDTGGGGGESQAPVYEGYRPTDSQPAPIEVPWAPPPLLAEAVPPQPDPDYSWTGGYWTWHDGWAWAPGRWSRPPRPDYAWQPPYYEHRDNRVVFVDGFWGAPGHSFVRPAETAVIAAAVIGAAFIIGRAPDGPPGSFVPPPPGSRYGLIVPAPPGTSPYVVRGQPAIVAPGMRITNNVTNANRVTNNTTVNRNTTIVNNVTNVTIQAPASSTANHEAVHATVSPQAHLAAGLPAGPVAPRAAQAEQREAPPPPAAARPPTEIPRARAPEVTRPAQEPARGEVAEPRRNEAPRPNGAPAAPAARPAVPPPHAADAHTPVNAPHPPAVRPEAAEHEQPAPHRAPPPPAPRPPAPESAHAAPAHPHAEPAAHPAPREQAEPHPPKAPAAAHPAAQAAHKSEPPAKKEDEKEREKRE